MRVNLDLSALLQTTSPCSNGQSGDKSPPSKTMPINRRQFITRTSLAAAGLTLARYNWAIANPAAKKIIIIGAGMAGLSAGYELSQLGHDVTILEARKIPG